MANREWGFLMPMSPIAKRMVEEKLLYTILRVYKYAWEHNQLIMTTSITN